jgi:hypothetical protein
MGGLVHLLAPLNMVMFTLGNDHVSAAELLGFVTGAASVWLTVLARISNFPVGRAAMTGWFADALTAAGQSWVLLTGSVAGRLALAVRASDGLIGHRARFGPAITDPAGDTGGGR